MLFVAALPKASAVLDQEVTALGMEGHLPDNTISSLSKLFRNIIPLIHDEVLIEDLEDLAARHVRHLLESLLGCSIEVNLQ